MTYITRLIIVCLFFSCKPIVKYEINAKTSEIGYLHVKYSKTNLDNLLETHKLPEGIYKNQKNKMLDSPFNVHILYFDSFPQEIIGFNSDTDCIRFVYNESIDKDKVLDGFSTNLDSINKKRIISRIENLLSDITP